MSRVLFSKTLWLIGMMVLIMTARFQLDRRYKLPFPGFHELITRTSGFQDAGFIVLGFRSLAADVAWTQLLQTMGDYSYADKNNKPYPYLKNDTLRVTRIDPFFHQAYLFGAATLAWLRVTNRPDEAMEILKEGIYYNPTYWPFRTYAAGIGYMKAGQIENMIRMLEDAIHDPDCPATVLSVLANSYKKVGRYSDAIEIWNYVLSLDKAREYHRRAREEIPAIIQLMNKKL